MSEKDERMACVEEAITSHNERISELEKKLEFMESEFKCTPKSFSIWVRKCKQNKKQIAELRAVEKISLDIIEVISKDYKNIKEVLRETMLKLELVGGYMCNPSQFKHIFDDRYWETKKKLEKLDSKSGGEKDNPINQKNLGGLDRPQPLGDSKPPEPKTEEKENDIKCISCNEYTKKNKIGHCKKYDCMLPVAILKCDKWFTGKDFQCDIKGCNKPVFVHDFCKEHYLIKKETEKKLPEPCKKKDVCMSYTEQNLICNETPEICGWNKLKEKTEPEKNIIGYIQEVEGLKTDIEWLKDDIRKLEKEKEYYRIEGNKDHGELREDFLKGLKGLIVEDDMEYFPKFQKDKYNQLIKEYEGMLK